MRRFRSPVATLIVVGALATSARAEPAAVSIEARLATAASEARHRLRLDPTGPSGSGWDLLVRRGREAQFVLLGEQHGIAENPLLAAHLFRALAPAGYEKLVIETSPRMAALLDRAVLDGGLEGLKRLFDGPGREPAFFNLAEEAALLAEVRAVVPEDRRALWGVDYEVAGDRLLLAALDSDGGEATRPEAARRALERLAAASAECWRRYEETREPRFIFSFCGEPRVAQDAFEAWSEGDREARWTLSTLAETLAINRLWSQGRGWESNHRRAQLLRTNFLRHWRAEKAAGRVPRALVKLGASHAVRGPSTTEVFDLGTLLPELAALEGRPAFGVLILAGPGSEVAVFDPSAWRYRVARPTDGYEKGLEPLVSLAYEDSFTLIELEPLRPLLPAARRDEVDPGLMRMVHGFDAVLILGGSTPATELGRAPAPEAERVAPQD